MNPEGSSLYKNSEAHDEANDLQSLVETNEAENLDAAQAQLEGRIEEELSLEAREAAMQKVFDVDTYGTAINYSSRDDLEIVLRQGLLPERGLTNKSETQAPKERLRNLRNKTVFFNIVGRSRYDLSEHPRLITTLGTPVSHDGVPIGYSNLFSHYGLGILIDISQRQELGLEFSGAGFSHRDRSDFDENLPTKSYWAETEYDDETYWMAASLGELVTEVTGHEMDASDIQVTNPEFLWTTFFKDAKPGDRAVLEHPMFSRLIEAGFIDSRGYPAVSPYHGFATTFRIPPRDFRGLVIDNQGRQYNNEEGDERGTFEPNSPARVHAMIQYMARKELKNPETRKSPLPIYGIDGSLLWPKEMSHEEVKTYIGERDAKKAEEKS